MIWCTTIMCLLRLVIFLKGPLWPSQPYLHRRRYFGSGDGFLRDFFSVGSSLCDARMRWAPLSLAALSTPTVDERAGPEELDDEVVCDDELTFEPSRSSSETCSGTGAGGGGGRGNGIGGRQSGIL